jgi:predicted NBD/HSP70 family sugar kinase
MKHRAQLTVTSQRVAMDTPSVIGLDLGDKWSRYCVLDSAGVIVEEDRVRSSAESLQERFGQLASTRIVIETDTLPVGKPGAGGYGPVPRQNPVRRLCGFLLTVKTVRKGAV